MLQGTKVYKCLESDIDTSHEDRFRHREAIINCITSCRQVLSFHKEVQSFITCTETISDLRIQSSKIFFLEHSESVYKSKTDCTFTFKVNLPGV